MSGPLTTAIAGVLLQPLKIITAEGGPVLHLLRSACGFFPAFPCGIGEIYFSELLPDSVKAWKRHSLQNQHFAVPAGLIRVVLYDRRDNSPTFGKLEVLQLGRPHNYNLLRVPHGIWYGFQCLSTQPALICNCTDLPHDPAESEKQPSAWAEIPWQWQAGAAGLG